MPETISVQPYDAHNQLLVRNVHPPDWANPEPAGRYNLVVIGAGTAGLVTAAGATPSSERCATAPTSRSPWTRAITPRALVSCSVTAAFASWTWAI